MLLIRANFGRRCPDFLFKPFCETEVSLLLCVEIWRNRSLREGARGVVAQEATQGGGGGGKLAFGEVIFIVFQFCCCRHSLVSHLFSSPPPFLSIVWLWKWSYIHNSRNSCLQIRLLVDLLSDMKLHHRIILLTYLVGFYGFKTYSVVSTPAFCSGDGRESCVKISARRSDILTEGFYCFPQSFQANDEIIHPSPSVCSASFPIHHSQIDHLTLNLDSLCSIVEGQRLNLPRRSPSGTIWTGFLWERVLIERPTFMSRENCLVDS
jgi:hypothetical protein